MVQRCALRMLTIHPQDLDLEDRPIPYMREASTQQLLEATKAEEANKKVYQQRKDQVLHEQRGYSAEGQEYDAYG